MPITAQSLSIWSVNGRQEANDGWKVRAGLVGLTQLMLSERRAKHQRLLVWGRCLLYREVKVPSKVEKDQQNVGEEQMMKCHISRKEFQELGD